MKSLLAKYYVDWLTSRAERVFFVYGMRRSGNHACVGWLVNALEGEAVTLNESPDVPNFNWSSSGKTFFINDVSTLDSRKYLTSLRGVWKRVRHTSFIVISAEDKDASYAAQWRIPDRSERIFVQRGTLNLMASRFQNLNRRAREGLGANMQSMKRRFFATLKANMREQHDAIWELEHWQDDKTWRRDFLGKLGLEHDEPPPMVGLGSSFSYGRALPGSDQMNQRFRMVEPQDAWIAFISRAVSEFPEVFTSEERELIRGLAKD